MNVLPAVAGGRAFAGVRANRRSARRYDHTANGDRIAVTQPHPWSLRTPCRDRGWPARRSSRCHPVVGFTTEWVSTRLRTDLSGHSPRWRRPAPSPALTPARHADQRQMPEQESMMRATSGPTAGSVLVRSSDGARGFHSVGPVRRRRLCLDVNRHHEARHCRLFGRLKEES